MSAPTTPLFTVQDLAKVLSLQPDTIYKMIADGRIRAVRIAGRSVRITAAELERITGAVELDSAASA
jgi:excisionase family DNA binding protein